MTDERFEVEFDHRPAGHGLIRGFDDGSFGFGWERPDGRTVVGVPYASEQAAGEALMETVVAWYGGMQ